MKSPRIISSLLVAAVAISFQLSAGIDAKYYEKISKSVWETPDSVFVATKTIADSIAANNSAVIIAWRDSYDVDNIIQNSLYKTSGETNRLRRVHLERVMVKLLDQNAVEKYTEFEFGENAEVKIMNRILAYKLKSAFGARIHKPDGSITDVDVSRAFEVGHGKKGKDSKSYKLAIPGLEAGDILEYFYHTDETAEEFSLDAQNLVMCSRYPVMTREISLNVDPKMTVEYKTYNGVPRLNHSTAKNGDQTGALRMNDIPAVNFERYVFSYRQLPFVRINFLNNTTERTRARSARGGGLRGNINTGKIYSEIGDYLCMMQYDSPLRGKAQKIVKDYFLKAKPDATTEEIADAAYLAVHYAARQRKKEDDKSSSSFERSLALADLLNKLGLFHTDSIGIGFINPRTDVPTAEIASWNEPFFTVNVPGGNIYYMASNYTVSPRELPGTFKGESGGVYYGERAKIPAGALISLFTVPNKKVTANSFAAKDTLELTDDDRIRLRRQAGIAGGLKQAFAKFTDDREWCEAVEDHLAIPDKQRLSKDSYDLKGRENEARTLMREMCGKSLLGAMPDSVTALNFTSRGITPESPVMDFSMECEVSGLVERLGDDLSVAIGRLSGTPEALSENERERLLDAMLPCAFQESRGIVLKIPEGYSVDEASLEDLKCSINNVVGMYYVNPVINDEGNLEITNVYRIKTADVPLSHWDKLRDLIDGASAFADKTIILTKN